MRKRLPLLAILAAALSAAAATGLPGDRLPPEALPPDVTPQAASSVATVPAIPRPAAAAWNQQVDRPLFVAGRRPISAVSAAPPAAAVHPAVAPPVAAVGVVTGPNGSVVLLRLADGRLVRATIDNEVEGWRVAAITAGQVELVHEGQVVQLTSRLAAASGMADIN